MTAARDGEHLADEANIGRWRSLTLRKLKGVNDQILRIKNGQDVSLVNMPIPGPGGAALRPLDRLNKFKTLLNETLGRLADGGFGGCDVCSQPLSKPELDEMPWARLCLECARKGKANEPAHE